MRIPLILNQYQYPTKDVLDSFLLPNHSPHTMKECFALGRRRIHLSQAVPPSLLTRVQFTSMTSDGASFSGRHALARPGVECNGLCGKSLGL